MGEEKRETIADLLGRNHKLLLENNRILKRMQRNARIAFWTRLLIIAIVIGVPVFFYINVVKPFLESPINVDSWFEANISTEDISSWLQERVQIKD